MLKTEPFCRVLTLTAWCSFTETTTFSISPAVSCPHCSYARTLSVFSACVCASKSRSQRAQTCQQMFKQKASAALLCAWLHAYVFLPCALMAAAVWRGDSPSSADKEWQYGNMADLCQQATLSSALHFFCFVSLKWKKKSHCWSVSS